MYCIFFRIDTESLDTLEKKSLLNSLIVCHTAHPHVMKNGNVIYNQYMKKIIFITLELGYNFDKLLLIFRRRLQYSSRRG